MDLQTVNRINASPYKAFLAIAGGGQTFIGDYCSISGASDTIVGAIVPYSNYVFDKFIKSFQVAQYASEEAARKLALAAYQECIEAGVTPWNALGIGAASSIVKDDERVGREHRFNIAVHNCTYTRLLSVTLKQGRTRQQEETMVNLFIFKMLAWSALHEPTTFQDFILTNEWCEVVEKSDFEQLLVACKAIDYAPAFDQDAEHLAFFCGSWNPFHIGHQRIYNMAEKILGVSPILELSLTNTDKGTLDFIDIDRRIRGMDNKPYILTNAATFVDKVKMLRRKFPTKKITFIVGADTWQRIWNPKYAGPLDEVEDIFHLNEIEFLVFGRGDTKIQTGYGEHLRIKDERAEAFTESTSSTQLRKFPLGKWGFDIKSFAKSLRKITQ